MSSRIDKNRIIHQAHGVWRDWLSAVSLVLFFISTTVFDTRMMLTQDSLSIAIFLPCLIFFQGYILWYYFNRFRPARKMFATYDPRVLVSYSWLFVVATVGSSVVALIGVYVI